MLAANAANQVGVALMAKLDAGLHQLGNAGIDGRERVVGKQVLREVLGHELRLNVIAAEAERRLSEIVGAEGEEVGLLVAISSAVTAARGSSIIVPTGMSSSTPSVAATSAMVFSATSRQSSKPGDLIPEHERDHDLGLRIEPLFLQASSRGRDGANLHDGKNRIHDTEAAAAQAEHRILLGERVDLIHEVALLADGARIGPGRLHAGDSTSRTRGLSRNSCRGGSSKRTITGSPSIALNMP